VGTFRILLWSNVIYGLRCEEISDAVLRPSSHPLPAVEDDDICSSGFGLTFSFSLSLSLARSLARSLVPRLVFSERIGLYLAGPVPQSSPGSIQIITQPYLPAAILRRAISLSA
jgi:hypothetical protein